MGVQRLAPDSALAGRTTRREGAPGPAEGGLMAAGTLRRALLGALALCLVASGAALADKVGSGAFKLEGAWIARVVGTNGQWSYVVSPDNSGRHATAHGSIDVGFA